MRGNFVLPYLEALRQAAVELLNISYHRGGFYYEAFQEPLTVSYVGINEASVSPIATGGYSWNSSSLMRFVQYLDAFAWFDKIDEPYFPGIPIYTPWSYVIGSDLHSIDPAIKDVDWSHNMAGLTSYRLETDDAILTAIGDESRVLRPLKMKSTSEWWSPGWQLHPIPAAWVKQMHDILSVKYVVTTRNMYFEHVPIEARAKFQEPIYSVYPDTTPPSKARTRAAHDAAPWDSIPVGSLGNEVGQYWAWRYWGDGRSYDRPGLVTLNISTIWPNSQTPSLYPSCPLCSDYDVYIWATTGWSPRNEIWDCPEYGLTGPSPDTARVKIGLDANNPPTPEWFGGPSIASIIDGPEFSPTGWASRWQWHVLNYENDLVFGPS